MGLIVKEYVAELEEQKKRLYEEINAIDNVIKGIQKICKHENTLRPRDSHKSYIKCELCGYETEE